MTSTFSNTLEEVIANIEAIPQILPEDLTVHALMKCANGKISVRRILGALEKKVQAGTHEKIQHIYDPSVSRYVTVYRPKMQTAP